jgi:hypothetical protein
LNFPPRLVRNSPNACRKTKNVHNDDENEFSLVC